MTEYYDDEESMFFDEDGNYLSAAHEMAYQELTEEDIGWQPGDPSPGLFRSIQEWETAAARQRNAADIAAGVAHGMQAVGGQTQTADHSAETLEGAHYRTADEGIQGLMDEMNAAERNLEKYTVLVEEAEAVGDDGEAVSMHNLARFEREKIAELLPAYESMVKEIEAERWERGAENYMSMSDAERKAFDAQYPGHADEAFRQVAEKSGKRALPQRFSDGKAKYVLHRDLSARQLADRVRETADYHPGLEGLPEHKRVARAKELDLRIMRGAVEYDPSVKPKEEEPEETAEKEKLADVEILASVKGEPEFTYLSREELEEKKESGPEPPKPQTNIRRLF